MDVFSTLARRTPVGLKFSRLNESLIEFFVRHFPSGCWLQNKLSGYKRYELQAMNMMRLYCLSSDSIQKVVFFFIKSLGGGIFKFVHGSAAGVI